MQTRRYLVIIEGTEGSYSAYAPDVPGCVAAGQTRDEVERLMQQALEFHIERMAEDGDAIPDSHSVSVEVPVRLNVAQAS